VLYHFAKTTLRPGDPQHFLKTDKISGSWGFIRSPIKPRITLCFLLLVLLSSIFKQVWYQVGKFVFWRLIFIFLSDVSPTYSRNLPWGLKNNDKRRKNDKNRFCCVPEQTSSGSRTVVNITGARRRNQIATGTGTHSKKLFFAWLMLQDTYTSFFIGVHWRRALITWGKMTFSIYGLPHFLKSVQKARLWRLIIMRTNLFVLSFFFFFWKKYFSLCKIVRLWPLQLHIAMSARLYFVQSLDFPSLMQHRKK